MPRSTRPSHRQTLTAAHFEELPAPIGLEAPSPTRSTFDVPRARDAYIPLLIASYALAHQTPISLPPGYTVLAEVRVDENEMVSMEMAGATPEIREAVMNDLEAAQAAVADPSAFGFVVREEATGQIIVSIRGTQTPGEWLHNFTAVPNPFTLAPGFGLVHLGFESMERSVRRSIETALQPIAPSTRVTVIGHSLGGAMATLAAVDLKVNMGRQSVDVCTFGGPRVGKFIFRSKFNQLISQCHRVTNRGDIVPHVPTMLTGWVHVGEEIEVDGEVENTHSLVAYLEGLRKIDSIRELVAIGVEEMEAPLPGVMSIRVM